jgi:hypothetical protein
VVRPRRPVRRGRGIARKAFEHDRQFVNSSASENRCRG